MKKYIFLCKMKQNSTHVYTIDPIIPYKDVKRVRIWQMILQIILKKEYMYSMPCPIIQRSGHCCNWCSQRFKTFSDPTYIWNFKIQNMYSYKNIFQIWMLSYSFIIIVEYNGFSKKLLSIYTHYLYFSPHQLHWSCW